MRRSPVEAVERETSDVTAADGGLSGLRHPTDTDTVDASAASDYERGYLARGGPFFGGLPQVKYAGK